MYIYIDIIIYYVYIYICKSYRSTHPQKKKHNFCTAQYVNTPNVWLNIYRKSNFWSQQKSAKPPQNCYSNPKNSRMSTLKSHHFKSKFPSQQKPSFFSGICGYSLVFTGKGYPVMFLHPEVAGRHLTCHLLHLILHATSQSLVKSSVATSLRKEDHPIMAIQPTPP